MCAVSKEARRGGTYIENEFRKSCTHCYIGGHWKSTQGCLKQPMPLTTEPPLEPSLRPISTNMLEAFG